MFADRDIEGLAVDWVTGNLYGVSSGLVFVCNAPAGSESLNCKNLLSGQVYQNGIALDPNRGFEFNQIFDASLQSAE